MTWINSGSMHMDLDLPSFQKDFDDPLNFPFGILCTITSDLYHFNEVNSYALLHFIIEIWPLYLLTYALLVLTLLGFGLFKGLYVHSLHFLYA